MDENIFVCVTGDSLDLNHYASLVADPGAGAISTFSGVTRNNFQGKAVLRLEYEAYHAMAVRKLEVRLEDADRPIGPFMHPNTKWVCAWVVKG